MKKSEFTERQTAFALQQAQRWTTVAEGDGYFGSDVLSLETSSVRRDPGATAWPAWPSNSVVSGPLQQCDWPQRSLQVWAMDWIHDVMSYSMGDGCEFSPSWMIPMKPTAESRPSHHSAKSGLYSWGRRIFLGQKN